MTRPEKKSRRKRDSNPGSSALEADALPTRPRKRCGRRKRSNLEVVVVVEMAMVVVVIGVVVVFVVAAVGGGSEVVINPWRC